MSLWVDKHRPTSISKLDYHKEQASRLKKLVRNEDADVIPLTVGTEGGSRLLVSCMARGIFEVFSTRIKMESSM